jgi:hypothetical protein
MHWKRLHLLPNQVDNKAGSLLVQDTTATGNRRKREKRQTMKKFTFHTLVLVIATIALTGAALNSFEKKAMDKIVPDALPKIGVASAAALASPMATAKADIIANNEFVRQLLKLQEKEENERPAITRQPILTPADVFLAFPPEILPVHGNRPPPGYQNQGI